MIRFALIAASTLGFFLTAALGNLMVPLLRAFQGRWDEPKARQAPSPKQEAPDAEPERPPQAPTMGGLCLMVGVLAAVGVGWTAACVAQPELLGAGEPVLGPAAHSAAGSSALWRRGPAGGSGPHPQPFRAGPAAAHPPWVGSRCRCRGAGAAGSQRLPCSRDHPAGRGLCRSGHCRPAAVGRAAGRTGRVCPHCRWHGRHRLRYILCGHAGPDGGDDPAGLVPAGRPPGGAGRGIDGLPALEFLPPQSSAPVQWDASF